MSISKELFLSILAMNAYDHGYNAQINVPGSSLGGATVRPQIIPDSWFPAGFDAVTYNVSGAAVDGLVDGFGNPVTTVISLRGTDNPTPWFGANSGGSHITNGWAAGAGTVTSQVSLALQYYQSVTGQSPYDSPASGVALPGHSLGGGLARISSILSSAPGVGFDYTPPDMAACILAADYGSQLPKERQRAPRMQLHFRFGRYD